MMDLTIGFMLMLKRNDNDNVGKEWIR